MALSEFALIQKYFARAAPLKTSHHTLLGIGDDAAVIDKPEHQQLVLTMDTLISDRHFPAHTDPADIAWKALAVNASDLVAMGAQPSWFLLSLTLPESDEQFLEAFSSGLFEAASSFQMELIGGDTCKGPLSITVQAGGLVNKDGYITRSGAQLGDRIFVTGRIGAAAVGLAHLQQRIEVDSPAAALFALNRPQPRIDALPLLAKHASAAIDISDGLVADLGHILENSQVGAQLDLDRIPFDDWIVENRQTDFGLYGGDDYQIVFTVNASDLNTLQKQATQQQVEIHEVGVIIDQGYYLNSDQGRRALNLTGGFDHFGT